MVLAWKESKSGQAGGQRKERPVGKRKFREVLGESRGMITVYLALSFLLIMGLCFCVIEGIREYELSTLEEDAFISAGRGILADYDKELYRQYRIFFLDPREKSRMEEDGREAVRKRFLNDSFYTASCREVESAKEVRATDYQGRILDHQIKELMKYETAAEAAEQMAGFIRLLQKVDYDGSRERIDRIQEEEEKAEQKRKEEEALRQKENDDGNQNEEKEAGQGSREGKQNLEVSPEGRSWKAVRSTITGILRGGILNYVMDDPGNISQARIPAGGLPSHMSGGVEKASVRLPGMSFSGIGFLSGYFSHNMAGDYQGPLSLEAMPDIAYAVLHFNRYGTRVNRDSVLRYEMEYLCTGRSSDQDNLKGVVRRIMLLRYAGNFAFASTDPEITGEAEMLAELLAGAAGMPELASAVKYLYIGALSYGETLLDVHSLLAGGKVPLVKTRDSWNLTLGNAAEKLTAKSRVKEGKCNVDYGTFLQILLLCQNRKSRLLYRMMDLMQINIRQKEPGFYMKDCLFSFQLTGHMYAGKWFPLIPGFGLSSGNIMETELIRTFSY